MAVPSHGHGSVLIDALIFRKLSRLPWKCHCALLLVAPLMADQRPLHFKIGTAVACFQRTWLTPSTSKGALLFQEHPPLLGCRRSSSQAAEPSSKAPKRVSSKAAVLRILDNCAETADKLLADNRVLDINSLKCDCAAEYAGYGQPGCQLV